MDLLELYQVPPNDANAHLLVHRPLCSVRDCLGFANPPIQEVLSTHLGFTAHQTRIVMTLLDTDGHGKIASPIISWVDDDGYRRPGKRPAAALQEAAGAGQSEAIAPVEVASAAAPAAAAAAAPAAAGEIAPAAAVDFAAEHVQCAICRVCAGPWSLALLSALVVTTAELNSRTDAARTCCTSR